MDGRQPYLPNPLTPFAFMPPDVEAQLNIANYIVCATTGAWSWDLCASLEDEIRMFWMQGRIKTADGIYILSKIAMGMFIFTEVAYSTAPLQDCAGLQKVSDAASVLGAAMSALLFLLRILALFRDQKAVMWFFSLLWVITAGSHMITPFTVRGVHLGPTQRCTLDKQAAPYESAAVVSFAVNDTLVFLAVTYKLVVDSPAADFTGRLGVFVRGRRLGQISKIVLQGNQQYYLATIGFNVVTAAMMLAPSVPKAFSALAVPTMAVQNIMACRIYRQLKLEYLEGLERFPSTRFVAQEARTLELHTGSEVASPPKTADPGTGMDAGVQTPLGDV